MIDRSVEEIKETFRNVFRPKCGGDRSMVSPMHLHPLPDGKEK